MRERIAMVVFILVLGTVLTSALVWVDRVTAPRIKQNETKKLHKSVLEALDIAIDSENIERLFEDSVLSIKRQEKTIYKSKTGECAFEFAGSGVWGPVTGVCAVQPDLKRIKGIVITHQEETPGLGDRVFDRDMLARYTNKLIADSIQVTADGKASADNEVDGIAGATLSSAALGRILNAEYKKYVLLLSEDK